MTKRKNIGIASTAKRPVERRGRTGPRGPQGLPGAIGERGVQGERGTPGVDHSGEIAALKAQVDQLVKELQTQLTRIGQIQAQLDHVTTGRESEPRNRRRTDRTEH